MDEKIKLIREKIKEINDKANKRITELIANDIIMARLQGQISALNSVIKLLAIKPDEKEATTEYVEE